MVPLIRIRAGVVFLALGAVVVLTGCSGEESATEQADATSSVTTSGTETPGARSSNGDESTASAPGGTTPDASDDAAPSREGRPTYTYEDAPTPASQEAELLCDLDQAYFRSLEKGAITSDEAVTERMQMRTLALSDRLSYWTGLGAQFPSVADDVTRAKKISELWEDAITLQQQDKGGDVAAALQRADALIAQLPKSAGGRQGCIP